MLPTTITKTHTQIIHSIYRFRFLNRPQIQTLTHSNDYRNTNKLLKYLTDTQYLERIYSTDIDKRHIPAKFYIGKQGRKFLKSQDYVEKALDLWNRNIPEYAAELFAFNYLGEKFKDSEDLLFKKYYAMLKGRLCDMQEAIRTRGFSYGVKDEEKLALIRKYNSMRPEPASTAF